MAERNLRSSLLVLGNEFMSPRVGASFLFRRRIYRSRRGRVQNFRYRGLSRRTGDVARTAGPSQERKSQGFFRRIDSLTVMR